MAKWTPMYPVNFVPKGDTTTVAFGKHIQEIERIYEILSDVDANSVDTGTVNTLITNAINNLKRTWKPSYSFWEIDGELSLSDARLTGELPASKVKGNLINAKIDAKNVNDLDDEVKKYIPTSSGSGDGIKTFDPPSGISPFYSWDGYVEFYAGFKIQFGFRRFDSVRIGGSIPQTDQYVLNADVYFPKSFSSNLISIYTQGYNSRNLSIGVSNVTTSGFLVSCSHYDGGSIASAPFYYLALGK